MSNFTTIIATELNLNIKNVANALELLAEGATIPFIARYRKERTGSLDEVQLRDISDRYNYLLELDKRKQTIKEAIAQQNKLTEELAAKIDSCLQKNELEDIYLPYKPKRRTRATVAREKGLTPLAEFIKTLNQPQVTGQSLQEEVSKYIDQDKEILTSEDALKGAADILAEEVSEKADLRAYLRDYLLTEGIITSRIKDDYPEGSTKYEMYRNYQIGVNQIPPHNLLALLRGEGEGILSLDISYEESAVMAYLESQEIHTTIAVVRELYKTMLKDAFQRLIKPSLMREIRSDSKTEADVESIKTFATNLRELLLSPPA